MSSEYVKSKELILILQQSWVDYYSHYKSHIYDEEKDDLSCISINATSYADRMISEKNGVERDKTYQAEDFHMWKIVDKDKLIITRMSYIWDDK